MNYDLCIGDGEVFWEFRKTQDRDEVWQMLIASYGWRKEWAKCEGNELSPRSRIVFYPGQIPIAYRWRCTFREQA